MCVVVIEDFNYNDTHTYYDTYISINHSVINPKIAIYRPRSSLNSFFGRSLGSITAILFKFELDLYFMITKRPAKFHEHKLITF